jgi:hypothetical protein
MPSKELEEILHQFNVKMGLVEEKPKEDKYNFYNEVFKREKLDEELREAVEKDDMGLSLRLIKEGLM